MPPLRPFTAADARDTFDTVRKLAGRIAHEPTRAKVLALIADQEGSFNGRELAVHEVESRLVVIIRDHAKAFAQALGGRRASRPAEKRQA